MPTYEYACTSCGHRLEVNQSFSDEPLTTCPECGGALRKVFGSVGIVLKGPGFYRTDSRSASATSRAKETGTDKVVAASGGDSSSSNGSSGSSDAAKSPSSPGASSSGASSSGTGSSGTSSAAKTAAG